MRTAMSAVIDFLRRDFREFASEWRLVIAPKGSGARNPFRLAFWRQQCQQFAIEWRLERLRVRSWRDANRLAQGIVVNLAELVIVVGVVAWLAHLFGMNTSAASAIGGAAGSGMLRPMLQGKYRQRH